MVLLIRANQLLQNRARRSLSEQSAPRPPVCAEESAPEQLPLRTWLRLRADNEFEIGEVLVDLNRYLSSPATTFSSNVVTRP
jgi:hypothetical protein